MARIQKETEPTAPTHKQNTIVFINQIILRTLLCLSEGFCHLLPLNFWVLGKTWI